MDDGMSRNIEHILDILRIIDNRLSQGEKIELVCQSLSISERSYHQWLNEYGGLMWIKGAYNFTRACRDAFGMPTPVDRRQP